MLGLIASLTSGKDRRPEPRAPDNRGDVCPRVAVGASCACNRTTAMTDIGTSRPVAQAFELQVDKSNSRVAEFEVRARSPLQKLQHFLHANPTAVPAIVLLLGVAAFGLIVGPRFLSMFNLSLIIQQVTIIGVIGAAQTFIVITAGIDLSVGAIIVLCSLLMGKLPIPPGLCPPP